MVAPLSSGAGDTDASANRAGGSGRPAQKNLPAVDDGRNSLLASIRDFGGTKPGALRHIDVTQEKESRPPPSSGGGLDVNSIAAALQTALARRNVVMHDTDESDDEDGDAAEEEEDEWK